MGQQSWLRLMEALGDNLFPCLSRVLEAFYLGWWPCITLSTITPSLILTFLPTSYKQPCSYIGPTKIIQRISPSQDS